MSKYFWDIKAFNSRWWGYKLSYIIDLIINLIWLDLGLIKEKKYKYFSKKIGKIRKYWNYN